MGLVSRIMDSYWSMSLWVIGYPGRGYFSHDYDDSFTLNLARSSDGQHWVKTQIPLDPEKSYSGDTFMCMDSTGTVFICNLGTELVDETYNSILSIFISSNYSDWVEEYYVLENHDGWHQADAPRCFIDENDKFNLVYGLNSGLYGLDGSMCWFRRVSSGVMEGGQVFTSGDPGTVVPDYWSDFQYYVPVAYGGTVIIPFVYAMSGIASLIYSPTPTNLGSWVEVIPDIMGSLNYETWGWAYGMTSDGRLHIVYHYWNFDTSQAECRYMSFKDGAFTPSLDLGLPNYGDAVIIGGAGGVARILMNNENDNNLLYIEIKDGAILNAKEYHFSGNPLYLLRPTYNDPFPVALRQGTTMYFVYDNDAGLPG
jgi:hypothetical protein